MTLKDKVYLLLQTVETEEVTAFIEGSIAILGNTTSLELTLDTEDYDLRVAQWIARDVEMNLFSKEIWGTTLEANKEWRDQHHMNLQIEFPKETGND